MKWNLLYFKDIFFDVLVFKIKLREIYRLNVVLKIEIVLIF